TNTYLPGLLAERFRRSRITAFSTGNVYPLVGIDSGGATEETPLHPVGEYGVTALGRERPLDYASRRHGTPVCVLRLNYAVETRYGVLVDLGQRILADEPIDLSMGAVNCVWQGYANQVALQSLSLASSPPTTLNLTGVRTLQVRALSEELGKRLGKPPRFTGEEGPTALLSDASRCHALFGSPEIDTDRLLGWIAAWLGSGLPTHGKPTKFQVRDGKF
ncbi:MAG: epimerase, partial [Planctomycetales bacterium]